MDEKSSEKTMKCDEESKVIVLNLDEIDDED
jgi:hypothetical protein